LATRFSPRSNPLARFPRLGRAYAKLGRDDVRELPVPPYRVIYRVDDAAYTVTVLVVWHGAMQGPPRPPE
jgi:plasmid stabilization system protein ParE